MKAPSSFIFPLDRWMLLKDGCHCWDLSLHGFISLLDEFSIVKKLPAKRTLIQTLTLAYFNGLIIKGAYMLVAGRKGLDWKILESYGYFKKSHGCKNTSVSLNVDLTATSLALRMPMWY